MNAAVALIALQLAAWGWDLTERSGANLTAAVTIDTADVIRQIPSTLYGTNIEWVWNGYALWDEHLHRPDPKLVGFARDMGVSLIRYPGGMYADFYHWRNGVGAPELRPTVPFRAGDAQTGRITFGTDEALRFASDAKGELMITVNVGTGTPEEAAAWVRYVNAGELKVRYWEIGNEVYIRDGSPAQNAINMDPTTYATRFIKFARAMKAADPRIRIGAIGGENRGLYNFVGYPAWNETILRLAGDQIDFLAVHNAYAPVNVSDSDDVRAVYAALAAAPVLIAQNLATLSRQIETYAPKRASQIAIAVTEWGPFFQSVHEGRFVQHSRTLGSALFSAGTLKAFVESGKTEIANFHTFNDMSIMCWVCSSDSGFPPRPVWTMTPGAMAFRLMRQNVGSQLIASAVVAPTYDSPKIGTLSRIENVPYLDVLSTISPDGNTVYVIAINRHFDNAIHTTISLHNFIPQPSGLVRILTGTGIDANTGTAPLQVPGVFWGYQASDPLNPRFHKGGPEEVTVAERSIAVQPVFAVGFPPRSVTALRLQRSR